MAKNTIYTGFFSLVSTIIIMWLSLKIVPNEINTSQESLKFIFGFLPRIVLASLVLFLISQTYDVRVYQFWKSKLPEFKYIWIRNNFSTLASQLIDGTLFTLIVFTGIFSYSCMFKIFITSYILKIIVSIFDTPFVYIAALLKNKNKINELREFIWNDIIKYLKRQNEKSYCLNLLPAIMVNVHFATIL